MAVRAEVTSPHIVIQSHSDSKIMKNDPTKESSFRKNERYRFEFFFFQSRMASQFNLGVIAVNPIIMSHVKHHSTVLLSFNASHVALYIYIYTLRNVVNFIVIQIADVSADHVK